MDIEKKKELSRTLARMNLNAKNEMIELKTYWCRIAFSKYDRWNYKEHGHSFFEVHLCLEGECVFDIDGIKITISKNSYIIIPPDKKHTFISATDDFEKFVWGFSIKNAKVNEMVIEGMQCVGVYVAPGEVISAIHVILTNIELSLPEKYSIIKGQLYLIFIYLFRPFLSSQVNTSEEYIRVKQRMKNIMRFISDNLSEGVSVKDIANEFYLSERQLTRICLSEVNMTPAVLKRSIQIEKVKELLSDESLSISQIAECVGFSDRYVLCKCFTRVEGVSPMEYRRSINKQSQKTLIIQ